MATSQAKTKQDSKPKYLVKNALINYYLAIMFCFFPLYFSNQYSNIRHDKYNIFLLFTSMLIIVELVILLSSFTNSNKLKADKKWYQTLSIPDICMIAFILLAFISTILSDNMENAITGNMGRNNGLILLLLYVAVYFAITRLYMFYEYIFLALAIGAGLVSFLAIINFFYIDPLNMFIGYAERYVIDFSSTIGNKNLLASYICVCLPVLMMLFMNTSNKNFKWVYFASMVLNFGALIVANSDSGYLGFFAFLVILLFYYIRKPKMLCMYFFSLFSMFAFAKVIRVFSFIMKDYNKGLSSIPSFFVYEGLFSFILVVLCGLLAYLFFFISNKNPELIFHRAVFWVAIGIFLFLLGAVVYMFVYYTFIDTTSKLNEIQKYFRFSNRWGTHRGYMWIKSTEIFSNFGIKDMLFGCGPDNYYYAFSPYFTELSTLYGDGSTNCAHNEYLNYLVTNGILGLTAYVGIIISTVVRAIKYSKVNPFAMICCSGVICYALQAIVNIAQPITTPIFILMICLTEAFCRQAKKNNTKKINKS